MGILNICLEFSTESASFIDNSDYKTVYDNFYKPAVSFLYSHPECSFSFYFSGNQLELLHQKNPELVELLKKLVNRKQVEILGGGYYHPVFPLLFPLDRTGQIEMLNSLIRKSIGKRPRGVVLCASAWDPSLVTSFETCGMDYVQLESNLIQKEKQLFVPIVMSDRGKAIKILPVVNELVPEKNEKPEEFIQRIKKTVDKTSKYDLSYQDAEKVCVVNMNKAAMEVFLKTEWAEEFLKLINEKYSSQIKLARPGHYVNNACAFVPLYIHAGISSDIAKWAIEPYQEVELKEKNSITIYDFMQVYKRSQALYNRMIFVSLLVNQCHGDKMRKNAAREFLWAAQSGDAYVCKTNGILVSSQERQNAYRKLTDAEKLVRECSEFKESVSNFDYNCDGFKEYVCRMDKYNACISLKGGSIFELDVMKKSGNYADNMSRIIPLDKCNDNYEKGIFVDHLFENEEYENFIKGRDCKNGVFSGNIYRESYFNAQKREIFLETNSFFPSLDQAILLKKKYTIFPNGIQVQYIIKNTSPIFLKAKFVVESNFAQTNFGEKGFDGYKIDVVDNSLLQEKTSESLSFMKNVDAFQLSDTDNNVSFMFEPNETANLVSYPITFMRKKTDSGKLEPAGRTLSLSLAWDVNLSCGMEMEKTINLTIIPGKKRKN